MQEHFFSLLTYHCHNRESLVIGLCGYIDVN